MRTFALLTLAFAASGLFACKKQAATETAPAPQVAAPAPTVQEDADMINPAETEGEAPELEAEEGESK